MAHDVFISYSSKDRPTADALAATLEKHGLSTWLAHRNIAPGRNWGESIIDAITGSRVLVLIYSINSNSSPQVQREIERAVNRDLKIFPFRIDDAPLSKSMQYFISTSQWLDAMNGPIESHFAHLATTIRDTISTDGNQHQPTGKNQEFHPELLEAATPAVGSVAPRNFHIADEMYRTAFGTVCTATPIAGKAPAGGDTFVAKIFNPPAADGAVMDFTTAADQKAGLTAFLKCVATQQQVSRAGKCWAPIHESGSGGSSAFFVTNYYPRTAQKLLAGRVVLNSVALQEIMNSVVAGLAELKRVCGRAHGNLKASNVLIAGRGEMANAKIVLTDPAPGPCDSAQADSEDMRCVGALLFQLVMHRPFHPTAWPVAETEEWARLGRRGTRWWHLCTELLSPDPQGRPNLAALQHALSSTRTRKFPVAKIAAAVIGVSAVVGGGGFGTLKWERSIRDDLAAGQSQWFAVVDDPVRATAFSSDARYAALLSEDKNRTDRIASLPPDGWSALNPTVAMQIIGVRSLVKDSRRNWTEALAADASELTGKISEFQKRGWNLPPAIATLPALSAAPTAADVLASTVALHDFHARVTTNDPSERWQAFEKQIEALRSAKNAFLPVSADSLKKLAGDAIALSEKNWMVGPGFDDCVARATRLSQKLSIQFDQARFAKDEPDINLDKPSLQDIDRWLSRVDLYVPVAGAGQKFADACAAEFTSEIAAPAAANPEQWAALQTPANVKLRSEIDAGIKALSKAAFLAKDVRQDSENSGPLYAQRTALNLQIESLRQLAYVPPQSPSEFFKNIPRPALRDPRLAKIWDDQINALAAKSSAEFTASAWSANKAKIKAVGSLLKACDDFTPIPALDAPYRGIAESRRHHDLDPLLDSAVHKLAGDMLTADAISDAQAAVTKASGVYAEWSNQVKDLAADFPESAAENQILEPKQFPDQAWTDAKNPARQAFWNQEVIATDGAFNAFLGSYVNRLANLRGVQTEDIRIVTLLAMTADAPPSAEILAAWREGKNHPSLDATTPLRPEILIAAWQRLRRDGLLAAPARIDHLADEGAIRENLRVVHEEIKTEKLRASASLGLSLKEEEDRGYKRWCDAFKSSGSPGDIQAAMAACTKFGLKFGIDSKPLPPAGKSAAAWAIGLSERSKDLDAFGSYNLTMALTQSALGEKDGDAARCRIDSMMSALDQLPAPSNAGVIPLAVWIKSRNFAYDEDFRLQLKTVLGANLYYFPAPAQSPSVLAQVLPAARNLHDQKKIDSAVAMLASFVDHSMAGLSPQMRQEWSNELIGLANAFDPAMTTRIQSTMRWAALLGNLDAMLWLGPANLPDPANSVAVIRAATPGNVRATLLLAQLNESGTGVPQSIDEARRLYTLAAAKGDQTARAWLDRDAASHVVVVKTDTTPKTTNVVTTDKPKDPEGTGTAISHIKIKAGN